MLRTAIQLVLITILGCAFAGLSYASEPALPGGAGFGASTEAGRGGAILTVTTLDDDVANPPAGSLREAIETTGARIIVFERGGQIELDGELIISEPYVTIAGQTAPGGVTLLGHTLRVTTHDVLVQHLKIRTGVGADEDLDSVSLSGGAEDVVFDHCSISWGIDENIGIFDASSVTFSNCIVAEGLSHSYHPKGEHSMGALVYVDQQDISMFRNIFANNRGRNPRVSTGASVAFENNVVYGGYWNAQIGGHPVGSDDGALLSLVGNVFLQGQNAYQGDNNAKALSYSTSSSSPLNVDTKVFMSDNLCEDCDSSHTTLADIWSNQVHAAADLAPNTTTGYLVSTRAEAVETPNFTPAPSSIVEISLSGPEGAGAFPGERDAVDTRILDEIENDTGWEIDCVGETRIDHGTGYLVASTSDRIEFAATTDPEIVGGYSVEITSGTGVGQIVRVRKHVDVDVNANLYTLESGSSWTTVPDATSQYEIFTDCANEPNAGGWDDLSTVVRALDQPSDPHDPMPTYTSYSRIEAWIQSFPVYTDEEPGIFNRVAETELGDGSTDCYEYQYQAQVTWETEHWASSQVRYRPDGTTQFTNTPKDSDPKPSHLMVVSGLDPGVEYTFEPISKVFDEVEFGGHSYATTFAAVRTISNVSVTTSLSGMSPVIDVSFDTDVNSSAKVHVRKAGETSWGTAAAKWSRGATSFSAAITVDDGSALEQNTLYEVGIQVFENNAYGGEDTMHPDGLTLGCDNTNTIVVQTPEVQIGSKVEGFGSRGLSLQVTANPSDSEVRFALRSPVQTSATLSIYNSAGKLVRRIESELGSAVPAFVVWDGKDRGGASVGRGIYYAKLRAGEQVVAKTVTLLR